MPLSARHIQSGVAMGKRKSEQLASTEDITKGKKRGGFHRATRMHAPMGDRLDEMTFDKDLLTRSE